MLEKLSYTLFRNSELIGILLSCLAVTGVLFFFFSKLSFPKQKETPNEKILSFVKPSWEKPIYSKKDIFSMILLTSLYAIVSLWKLGNTFLPTTTWQPSADSQEFILELTNGTQFDAVYTIYCEGDNNTNLDTWQLGNEDITLYGSNDLTNWETMFTLQEVGIYEYEIDNGNWNYKYIKLSCSSKNDTLSEIGFKAYGKEEFLNVSVYEDAYASSNYPATLVIDEQDKLVINPTYEDQGYFDEVYHPRNATEIVNGQYMYATVHPLLGTNLIALGIKIFGLNPFGWRIMGALFGIAMVPLFYALLKVIFRKNTYAMIGSILFCCDFMHITTSRIGTLEPFSIFFILLMFYFMFRYYYTSFYDTSLKKQLKLLLACGISMGLAIATKWTACYSAIGLAILLFTNLGERFVEYRKAKNLSEEELTNEQLLLKKTICSSFVKNFWITIGWCFVFFIFIPVIIYWLSYLPDLCWRDGWSIANVWNQNIYMYNYHINLTATHPYESTWYMWIVDARPIWYYYGTDANGYSNSISCFSNPLLTWAGLFAFVYVTYRTIRKKDKTGFALLVGYLTALAPWILFVKRCCFSYHFYPSSIFLILILVYAIRALLKHNRKWKKWIYLFLGAYIFLFVVFLPVTCGFGTSLNYIKLMEWFPSWYFG